MNKSILIFMLMVLISNAINVTGDVVISSDKDNNYILQIPGESITFTGEAKYGIPCYEEPHYRYTWKSSLDGWLSNSQTFTMNATSLSLGKHNITLIVRDCAGSSDVASTELFVVKPLNATIVNIKQAEGCGIVRRFSDNSLIKEIEFPPGGGSNSDAKIQLPMGKEVCDASFNIDTGFIAIKNVELVFVVDSSPSMNNTWRSLCDVIENITLNLTRRGFRVKRTIYALNEDPGYKCVDYVINSTQLDNSIVAMDNGLVWIPNAYSHAWTVGIYWVAKNRSWTGARHIVFPISNDIATSDPDLAVEIAANAANEKNIEVYGLWTIPLSDPNVPNYMIKISSLTDGKSTHAGGIPEFYRAIFNAVLGPVAHLELNIGSDAIIEWEDPEFRERVKISKFNTMPRITRELTRLLRDCNCFGCRIEDGECIIDLKLTATPEIDINLTDLYIQYCDTENCPSCIINFTGKASGGLPPYKVRWRSSGEGVLEEGIIDEYYIAKDSGEYNLVATPPLLATTSKLPSVSSSLHNITFEVEDSLGLKAFDKRNNVQILWCCAINTPCTKPWPGRQGNIVCTGNEESYACDIYEVCHPKLWSIAREAVRCCKNNCIGECHPFCRIAYEEGRRLGLKDGEITSESFEGLKMCEGLYIIYGLGSAATIMEDYFWPEICCSGDEYCIEGGKCCISDLKWCRCRDRIYNKNVLALPCVDYVSESSVAWASDVAMNKNTCRLADLPAHASILEDEGIHTGTCVDYSNALTTLLRIVGYNYDEVYSTTGPGHAFNLVRFPRSLKWNIIDTTGNKNPYSKFGLPPGGYSTRYCLYNNDTYCPGKTWLETDNPREPFCLDTFPRCCKNDAGNERGEGIVVCPSPLEVYGC